MMNNKAKIYLNKLYDKIEVENRQPLLTQEDIANSIARDIVKQWLSVIVAKHSNET